MSRPSFDALSDFVRRATLHYQQVANSTAPADDAASVHFANTETRPAIAGPRSPASSADGSWQRLSDICAQGEVTSGIVTGWNRGGLLVRWNDLQGFLPASQLMEVPVFLDDESRDDKLSRWVGEELRLKVIELDQGRNRLVFSERATLWGPKDAERLLAELAQGDVREGHVSNLCDFGAFVDLGGLDGLIHISELSWGRVIHPGRHLRIGQRVRVYVLTVDREGRHIALSLKRLLPNPWSLVDERYRVSQIVDAVVTNLVEFGAFAQLEEGLEGLIHVSEMVDGDSGDARSHLVVGDRVQVRILRIDAPRHRLSLSVHLAPPSPGDDLTGDDLTGASTAHADDRPAYLY